MPGTETNGYLVQLQSPEGENVYPIISAEMIKDKNGETYDLPGLFQSVSEGKSAIAAAVTDKGVTTAADASFEQIAANIGSISTTNEYVDSVIDDLTLPTSAGIPGGTTVWSAAIQTPITVKNTSNDSSTVLAYIRRDTGVSFFISRYDQSGTEHFRTTLSADVIWEYPLIPKIDSISFVTTGVENLYGFNYDWGSVSFSATGVDSEYIYMNMTCTPKSGFTVNDSSSPVTVPLYFPNEFIVSVSFKSNHRSDLPLVSATF